MLLAMDHPLLAASSGCNTKAVNVDAKSSSSYSAAFDECPCRPLNSGESGSYDTPSPSSQSELQVSDDDNDNDDDHDAWIFTDPTPEYPTLNPGHGLYEFVDELAKFGIAGAWLQHVQREHVPQRKRESDMGPSCQPAKRKRSSGTSDMIRNWKHVGTSAEPGGPVQGEPFQCPFFARNPTAHPRCLRHNLRRIIDVKRHIWASHRQPHHCPICHTIFETAREWNIHIRDGQCERSTAPEIEGASEDQLDELSWPPNPDQNADEQWFSVWNTVFPHIGRPLHPRLTDHSPFVQPIRLLRDYWEAQGREKIREFLDSKAKIGNEARRDKQSLQALHGSVLSAMIDQILTSFVEHSSADSEL
ncbi:hypothetical protein B0H67DRAFT_572946 [Lasiosphaeris hirsuta]|uniref:C2H2-type domain-containing protein n=1 Tax=Lasiosphaeris hirsuta TaxID=260670 RepID=A0AA40AP21_9PEZI|nr:hypothetical protein B0H67DRAFT_572946 [Lasiosphaeris hirsuta]